MTYTLKTEDLSDRSLQFMIDWCISGLELGNMEFKSNFIRLLSEKLKRQEID